MTRGAGWGAGLLLLAVGCADASDSAVTAPQVPSREAAQAPSPPREATECERLEARYLEARTAANRCERDSDCAEQWPGLCPHGPYYTHVAADHRPIIAASDAIVDACEIPECEKPMPLGIGHCEAGRCERGRSAPSSGPHESCWDTEVTWMQPGRPYLGAAHEHLQGITPLHAVHVPGEGVLRIEVTLGCEGCELHVSEHNSGMGSRVEPTPVDPEPADPDAVVPVTSRAPPALGRSQHLEIPVTPGPYYLAALGADGDVQFSVRLRHPDGRPMTPDRRGVAFLRTCEG